MTTFLREAFTPGTSVLVPEGPNGAVFADGKRARTVIFICDGSGTMVVKLQHLKVALSQAVDALHDDQQMMNVIFFSDGTATAFDSRAQRYCKRRNKGSGQGVHRECLFTRII